MGDGDIGELQRALLEAMRAPGFRPATLRTLMRTIGIGRDRRHSARRALKALLDDDRVVRVGGDRFAPQAAEPRRGGPVRAPSRGAPPAEAGRRDGGGPRGGSAPKAGAPAGTVSGTVQRHPRGFGFVTPDAGGPDIFIPPRAVGDLLNGDRVAVRVQKRDRSGRSQGEIVRVLERSRRRILGVFRHERGRGPGRVEAYDRLFAAGIEIPEGSEGDAGDGMVVGVEIVRPPMEHRGASGRIVEVLGRPNEPGMDLRTVVRKYDLRTEFPADVERAARGVSETVPRDEIARREDFRNLPIVTIDGETAKDFDDAVHVHRNPDGTWELQVHIADVAHYVRPRTPIDREAYERGTSVYFPGTALPMLPERLSNGICSLNPGVDRLVQSCIMVVDSQGKVVAHRFADGVIRTVERMTYTNVARILVDRDPAVSARYRPLVAMFRDMEELCGILNARRSRRGSIDFDLPEPEIILEVTGEMSGIVPLERNIAHRLIEEFMLAANETVASALWRARVPSIYRIHERPDPRRLEEFDRVAQAFGYRLSRPFTSIRQQAFQEILDMMKGRPEERFLSRRMLQSMKQARYAEKRDIHFGLAATCYTHFTSPIRRYPDLIVHRILHRVRTDRPLETDERAVLEEFLPEAALHSSRMERNADAAENELVAWKKAAFMSERVGEEFDGLIVAVQPFGILVELLQYYIDGLVPIETLEDDDYRFHEKKQILRGDRHGRIFKLGDRARIRVDRVNQFQLQLEFSLVEERPAGQGRGGRRVAARRSTRKR